MIEQLVEPLVHRCVGRSLWGPPEPKWARGYDRYHAVFNRVDLSFLKQSPVLGYFKQLPEHKKNSKYIHTMLGTKVFPCADVTGIGDPQQLAFVWKSVTPAQFRALITDDKELADAAQKRGFKLELTREGNSEFSTLYHLRGTQP